MTTMREENVHEVGVTSCLEWVDRLPVGGANAHSTVKSLMKLEVFLFFPGGRIHYDRFLCEKTGQGILLQKEESKDLTQDCVSTF